MSAFKVHAPSPIAQSVALQTSEQEVAGSIPGSANIFLRTDDIHCIRIHSSLTAVHCFDNGYVGKQPVAWKEYCTAKRTPGKHGQVHWPP